MGAGHSDEGSLSKILSLQSTLSDGNCDKICLIADFWITINYQLTNLANMRLNTNAEAEHKILYGITILTTKAIMDNNRGPINSAYQI